MLILSRKRHQRIRISDNIWLEVLHTGRSTVKLGFTAPLDLSIVREELIGRDNSSEHHEVVAVRQGVL